MTYADVEDALIKWFVDIPISGPLMLSKARSFASLLDFPNFSPGNAWLHWFKALHGIVFENHCQQGSLSEHRESLCVALQKYSNDSKLCSLGCIQCRRNCTLLLDAAMKDLCL